jgi:hypothetical protein
MVPQHYLLDVGADAAPPVVGGKDTSWWPKKASYMARLLLTKLVNGLPTRKPCRSHAS